MSLYQLFKESLHSPKKIAAFRLVPIGKVMQYIFIYIFLLTILSFISFINGISLQQESMEGFLVYFSEIEWLLYPFAFVFLFVLNTLFIFVRISVFGYIAQILLKLKKRRGEYRHLWRSALFASTLPMLLTLLFTIFQWSNTFTQLVVYGLTLLYLYLATTYYPKQR